MGLVVVLVVSFLICLAVFALLILGLELSADYWFPEDRGSKHG